MINAFRSYLTLFERFWEATNLSHLLVICTIDLISGIN